MTRSLRVGLVCFALLLSFSRLAAADSTCDYHVRGVTTSGPTDAYLFDDFQHIVWDDNYFSGLGLEPDESTCVNDVDSAIYALGYDLCSQHETGKYLNLVGDVYFGPYYSTTVSAPLFCSSYGLNVYTSLPSGYSLSPGQYLDSGSYRLIYQTDGNLVVYNGATVVWAANCWATCNDWGSAGVTTMQTDGNLVVYNSDSTAVWASSTDVNNGAFAALRNSGELVVYTQDGDWLWSSVRGHHY